MLPLHLFRFLPKDVQDNVRVISTWFTGAVLAICVYLFWRALIEDLFEPGHLIQVSGTRQSWASRLVFVLGLALVAGVAGWLGYQEWGGLGAFWCGGLISLLGFPVWLWQIDRETPPPT